MITVKEEFLTDAKTARAVRLGGSAAIHLWLALKGYAASKLTDGFVPDDAIDDLPGAPKQPRKVLAALVDCGATKSDGSKGAGLVDKVDHGWQLHDYLDHSSSADEESARRGKERARKALYRALKTLAEMLGERIEDVRKRFRGEPTLEDVLVLRASLDGRDRKTGQRGTLSPGQVTGHVPVLSPGRPSHAHVPDAGARPRAPQPSPAQPSPASGSSDSSDSPDLQPPPDLAGIRPDEPQQRLQHESLISCPRDLKLTDDQIGTLEVSGVRRDAIAPLTAKFVAKAIADPDDKRPLKTWRKCLATSVSGDWNDPRRRPKAPGQVEHEARTGRQEGGYRPPDDGLEAKLARFGRDEHGRDIMPDGTVKGAL